MDEITDKKLYPHEDTPLLKHYSSFDRVFVGLIPFFLLDKVDSDILSSSRELSIDEARAKDDIFNEIGQYSNVSIYSSNENYPSDEEIADGAKKVLWGQVNSNSRFDNINEINIALMTSIGALNEQHRRTDLLEILDEYTSKEGIWHPTEGTFDYFTKAAIYELLFSKGLTEVVVENEYYTNSKHLDLRVLSCAEFCKSIDFKDYYIYTKDKSILFAISWDFYFYFIAIQDECFQQSDIEEHFEGFWATKNTSHNWAWMSE